MCPSVHLGERSLERVDLRPSGATQPERIARTRACLLEFADVGGER